MTEISPPSPLRAHLRPRNPGSPGRPLLRPVRLGDFRLLFAGEMVSVLGDKFHF
jgi:hypothetical protein